MFEGTNEELVDYGKDYKPQRVVKVIKRKRQYMEIAKPKLLKNSPKLVVELKAILMN